jgi:TRAP-type C4-dicarboxylate transport system substrate-binding protein
MWGNKEAGMTIASILRRSSLIICAGLAVSAPAAAEELQWKLNNTFALPRTETKLLHLYADEVNKRTAGKLKVTVYDGGSLGLKDQDILRWLPAGGADIGVLSASFVGRDAPELNAVYIQGSISSAAEHQKALPALEAIYTEAVKKWEITPVAFMRFPVFNTSIFCRDKKINSLAELKGKKLRVWSKDLVETFSALGVAAQIIGQNEMYVAMQTGVVDCALYPDRLAPTVSLQEVVKYGAYLFPVAAMPYVVGVSTKKWQALPKDVQESILAAGKALYDESKKYEQDAAAEEAAKAKMQSAGVTFLDAYSDADRKAFVAAATTTWAALAKDAGPTAVEYRGRVLKALGR